MKDELEKQIGKIATKYIYKDGDIYVFYSRKHLNKAIKEIAGLFKQPTSPTLSREKVIEVLRKHLYWYKVLNTHIESIASELCASDHFVDVNDMVAGEREERTPDLDCGIYGDEPPSK
jgi:hypothetical protein